MCLLKGFLPYKLFRLSIALWVSRTASLVLEVVGGFEFAEVCIVADEYVWDANFFILKFRGLVIPSKDEKWPKA